MTTTLEVAEELDRRENEGGLELTVKKSTLQAALERVAPALPSTDVVPILRNFHIDTRASVGIKVMATRVDLTRQTAIPDGVSRKGGVTILPAQKLISICKEAPEGDLTITATKEAATISIGRASWNLTLKDFTQFPDSPSFWEYRFRTVPKDEFLAAVRAVVKAASREVSRANLTMIDIDQGRMRASDGTRLQQVAMKSWPKDFDIQIPTSIVSELTKMLRASGDTDFSVAQSDTHLVFHIGNEVLLSTKLIVKFPPIDKQLLGPAVNNTDLLQVNREALASAIKRVRIVADPESPAVVLKLTKNKLTVVSQDKRQGALATEEIDIAWDLGKRALAFNAQPLLDLLAMTEAESCDFWLGADNRNQPSSLYLKNDDGLVGVLNQMRIDWLPR